MVVRVVVQTCLWLLFTAALLFVAAGTVRWGGGWAYILLTAICSTAVTAWLFKHDPGLLAERLKSLVQREQKMFDKMLVPVFFLLYYVWLAFMAMDAARFAWSSVPLWLQAAGVVLCVAGYWVVFLAFKVNSFAAPVIKIQRSRHQKVIDYGPYAVVRHPMYAGSLPIFAGTALMLGSWWGLFGAVTVMILPLIVRIILEERTLEKELDGYADYMKRVRSRLIPGLW